MARDLWTDERLDELNVRVNRGFEATRREFVAMRTEMKSEFSAVRAEIGSVRTELSGQIAATQRMMIQLLTPQTIAMVLGFAGLILTHA